MRVIHQIRERCPKHSSLVYESTHDDKGPIAKVDAFVNQYCEANVSVDYRRCEVESHTIVGVDGVFGALAWAKKRFDSLPMGRECTTSTHISAFIRQGRPCTQSTSSLDKQSPRYFPQSVNLTYADVIGKLH